MSLSHVQKLFVEATGRQDLAEENDTSPLLGARWFLNQAQRYLDGRFETPKSAARHIVNVAAGQYVVHVPQLRTVREVWLTNSEGARTELAYERFSVLRTNNPQLFQTQDVNVQNIAASAYRGTTESYGIAVSGLSPATNLTSFVTLTRGQEAILPGDHFTFKSIVLMAPPEAAQTLDLVGLFYSPELSLQSDKSYWTESMPAVLVAAACMIHEGFLRNSEGVKDWLNQVELLMFGVNADVGDPDGPDSLVMGG